MSYQELVMQMLSPPVLFFAIGILAALLRSDLKIPDAAGTIISVFILASIGLRAGVAVNDVGIASVVLPALLAIFTGTLLTAVVYGILIGATKVGAANAASIAGHYGGVSSVTLAVAIAYVDNIGANYEAFVPALYPFMDTAALLTAVVLSRLGMAAKKTDGISAAGLIRETMTSKAPLLLICCFFIGLVHGKPGTLAIMPVFDQLFQGVLTIFMLDIGIIAGSRLSQLLTVDRKVFALGLVLPPIHGLIAVVMATAIGLSPGGATIFAALAAGVSYISAPAVMRMAVPEANPSLPLTMALGLAFPFNVSLGIPLYYQAAHLVPSFL